MGYTEHRLSADLAAGITPDDFGSPYSEHAYRVLGIDLGRGTLLLSARAAGRDDAELLDVAAGTPLFVYERTLLLGNGRRLEWSQAILRADAARFRAEFTVPRAPGASTLPAKDGDAR